MPSVGFHVSTCGVTECGVACLYMESVCVRQSVRLCVHVCVRERESVCERETVCMCHLCAYVCKYTCSYPNEMYRSVG